MKTTCTQCFQEYDIIKPDHSSRIISSSKSRAIAAQRRKAASARADMIKQLHDQGWSGVQLAEAFKTSYRNIRASLNGGW